MRARWAGFVGAALALCAMSIAGSAHALPSSGHFRIVLDDLKHITPLVGYSYREVTIEADYLGDVTFADGTFTMDLVSEGVTGVSSRLGDLAMGDVTITASGVETSPHDVVFEVDVPFFNLYGFTSDDLGEWHNQEEPAHMIATSDGDYSAGPVSIGWYHKTTGAYIRVGSIELTSLRVDDGGGGDASHSPEPATLLLMGMGLVGAAGARRRSRRHLS